MCYSLGGLVLNRSTGKIIKPVVWLTTDCHPEGHGLLVGTEILNEKQKAHMERVQGKLKNNITANKTKVRFKVKVSSSDKNLISFNKYSKKHESVEFSKRTGLSAYYNFSEMTNQEIENLREKNIKTKESTWYLYFGEINPTSFINVDLNKDGKFIKYDFEDARQEFLMQGFSVPSKNSLEKLQGIFPKIHKFDEPKAFCFFNNQDLPPCVHIRGGGINLLVTIDDIKLLYGNPTKNFDELVMWIKKTHRRT